MQSNRFVSDDVSPGKSPVFRAMVSDDELWRELISEFPETLQNKTLIVPASSCIPTRFLLYSGYIYRR